MDQFLLLSDGPGPESRNYYTRTRTELIRLCHLRGTVQDREAMVPGRGRQTGALGECPMRTSWSYEQHLQKAWP